MKKRVDYDVATNPLYIDGSKIEFVETAEHVGLLRASSGNLPTILEKFSAHSKALGAVLHTGMARGHRGNPAAGLHLEILYGVPVLLSGLAALILSKSEEDCINHASHASVIQLWNDLQAHQQHPAQSRK